MDKKETFKLQPKIDLDAYYQAFRRYNMDYQKDLEICRSEEVAPWTFTVFARNNIEQYITRCVELEAENKRLREAITKYLHSKSEADACPQCSLSEIRGDGPYCESHSDYTYEALKALRKLVQP